MWIGSRYIREIDSAARRYRLTLSQPSDCDVSSEGRLDSWTSDIVPDRVATMFADGRRRHEIGGLNYIAAGPRVRGYGVGFVWG